MIRTRPHNLARTPLPNSLMRRTVLDDAFEMLAAGIEARQELPCPWSHVSRLVVITGESPDRLERFKPRQRREFHLPAGDAPPQNRGAVVAFNGMN